MKCPLCKTPSLDATVLAPDLEGCICGECNGVWIARTKYDAWRKRLPKDIPETASDAEFSVNDTRVAKTDTPPLVAALPVGQPAMQHGDSVRKPFLK